MINFKKNISFLEDIENPISYKADSTTNKLEVQFDIQYEENAVFSFHKSNNVLANTRIFSTEKTRESGRTIPAPTIELRQGSHLTFKTSNNLPSAETHKDPENINFPYGFNDYNMHTHGLHVSPKSPSDNVCMVLKPGDKFTYEYDIPKDHPCGVYWYHPHKHGSVAIQVGSGMAGMMIVRGEFDDELEKLGVKEYQLVFQSIPADKDGLVEDMSQVFQFPNSEYSILVNGQFCPVIKVNSGEVLNLRLLNATTRTSIDFKCPSFAKFYTYSFDGNPLDNYRIQNGVSLGPANRQSTLVKIDENATPGSFYYVYNDVVEYQHLPHYKYHNNSPLFVIAVDKGSDLGSNIHIPSTTPACTTIPPFPKSLRCDLLKPIHEDEITNRRTITLQANTLTDPKKHYKGLNVSFDHKPFAGCHDVNHIVELDAVEEWTLINESNFAHPIHIHVNPYYIIEVKGEDPLNHTLELPFWADTFFVPANGHVKFRTRFKDFTGKYPIHCHLLYHEDCGMMQHVEVVDKNELGAEDKKDTECKLCK